MYSRPTVSRTRMRLLTEGPRWFSTRAGIWTKYFIYLVLTILSSLVTGALLDYAGTTRYGGLLLLFAITVMFVTAAIATAVYPTQRADILQQTRHYVFGLCMFPAVALAALLAVLSGVITAPAAAGDTLASLLGFALPAVFIITVVLPPIVFVKAVAGYHTLSRSTQDDSELVAIMSRQDGLQR